jgi:hypothetical protein
MPRCLDYQNSCLCGFKEDDEVCKWVERSGYYETQCGYCSPKLRTPEIEPSGSNSGYEAELREIANIAHHGGLLGFKTQGDALSEIRKLTLQYWDQAECEKLQNGGA